MRKEATRDSAVQAFLKVSYPSWHHPSAQVSALFYFEPFTSTSTISGKQPSVIFFFPSLWMKFALLHSLASALPLGQGLLLLEPGVKEWWLFNILPS